MLSDNLFKMEKKDQFDWHGNSNCVRLIAHIRFVRIVCGAYTGLHFSLLIMAYTLLTVSIKDKLKNWMHFPPVLSRKIATFGRYIYSLSWWDPPIPLPYLAVPCRQAFLCVVLLQFIGFTNPFAVQHHMGYIYRVHTISDKSS